MIGCMRVCLSAVVVASIVGVIGVDTAYSAQEAKPHGGARTAHEPTGGAEPAAGADAAGGHSEHGPVQGELAFWTLFVFGGLLFVLRAFAWKPLVQALDAREKHLRDSVLEATRAREQAKSLLAEHDKKLAETQIEVRSILDEARRDAERARQAMLDTATVDAQALRERAERDIARARDHALKELFEQAGVVATEVASRIVQQQLRPEDHRVLVQRALSEMGHSQN